jgi:hypothetical protein
MCARRCLALWIFCVASTCSNPLPADDPTVPAQAIDFDSPTAADQPTPAPAPEKSPVQSQPGGAPAEAYECPRLCRGIPRWTVTVDGLSLWRSGAEGPSPFRDQAGRQAPDLFRVNDLAFDPRPGFRFAALYRTDLGWDLELNYFQLDGWEAAGYVPGNVVLGAADTGFTVDDCTVRYRSELYSGEVNLRRHRGDRLTLLAGLRFAELDDRLHVDSTGHVMPWPVTFEGRDINHLYGFQLGADAALVRRGRLEVRGLVKAGVYDNHIDGTAAAADGPMRLALGSETDHCAFLGEASLVGKFRLGEHLAVRGGYQVMWLDGVALGPAQIGLSSDDGVTATINTRNTLFLHGAIFGLEAAW